MNSLPYRSGGQNPSHWANVKVWAGLVPSGGSRGESVSLLFFRMDVVLTPWLVAPHHTAFSLSTSIFPTLQVLDPPAWFL